MIRRVERYRLFPRTTEHLATVFKQIRGCSVAKPSDSHGRVQSEAFILKWNLTWSFELQIEMTPRAPFQKLYTVKLPIF